MIEDISPHEIEDDNHFIDPKLPGGLTDFQIIDPGPEEMDTLLPPTLETRRKRKPSPIATSKTEHALDPEPTITHRDLKLSTKPGAKRKFVSEDEEIFESTSVDEDDFQYTRPSHLQHQEDQPTPAHIENSPSKKQVDKKRGSRENGPSKRKVLEPSMKLPSTFGIISAIERADKRQKAQTIALVLKASSVLHKIRKLSQIPASRMKTTDILPQRKTTKSVTRPRNLGTTILIKTLRRMKTPNLSLDTNRQKRTQIRQHLICPRTKLQIPHVPLGVSEPLLATQSQISETKCVDLQMSLRMR